MREYREVTYQETKRVPTSITCNKCGKSDELEYGDYQDITKLNNYHNFSVEFGYGSLFDMEKWDFELCEKCLVDFVRTFKYLPNGYDKEYVDRIYKK